jgi:hypothetical protein
MKHIVSSKVEQERISNWMMQAQPVDKNSTWTERRMAIDIGGHTYLVVNDQIFQCAHCGRYDPQWSITQVLSFIEETIGAKPYEIEITCSIKVNDDTN